MFKTGKLVGFAVVVLVMSGCASAGASETARVAAPTEAVVSAEVTAAAEPSAAPVAIEPAAAAGTTDNFNGFGSQREWFLRTLDDALSGVPSDDDLIAAGALACEQLTSGTALDAVRVVEGGTDQDNLNIVSAAVQVYCPEFY